MENKHCPFCGNKTLRFIETCDSNSDEVKTSWTCDCEQSNGSIIYIYEFAWRKNNVKG